MSENRPRSPDRKLALIAPIAIAVVVAVILLVAVLSRNEAEEPAEPLAAPEAPRVAPPAPPTAPAEPEAVTRADLIADANLRAAAYTMDGEAAPPTSSETLVGRRFAIRIPFGCEGPQVRPGAAQAFYEFDPDARTLRLVARAAVWTTLPIIQDLPKSDLEAVEGFWVPHPWSPSENCPVHREGPIPAAPTSPAAQTLGLAQLFETGGSRLRRRGDRPYEHLIKLGETDRPRPAGSYRLLLEGRFITFPRGRVAHCWSESPDHRPLCIYAVAFERVAFERGGGELLAEWRD